jgi:hypothetical protein
MKTLLSILFATMTLFAIATQDQCCGTKAEAKTTKSCAMEAKQTCDSQAKSGCGLKTRCADDEFMAEAHRMMMAAEGKSACCKSTASKPMAKGDAGCCNAKGEAAKFKIYVAGAGYKYFGCEGSAAKGRKELVSKGQKVGKVQKVTSSVAMR